MFDDIYKTTTVQTVWYFLCYALVLKGCAPENNIFLIIIMHGDVQNLFFLFHYNSLMNLCECIQFWRTTFSAYPNLVCKIPLSHILKFTYFKLSKCPQVFIINGEDVFLEHVILIIFFI